MTRSLVDDKEVLKVGRLTLTLRFRVIPELSGGLGGRAKNSRSPRSDWFRPYFQISTLVDGETPPRSDPLGNPQYRIRLLTIKVEDKRVSAASIRRLSHRAASSHTPYPN
jgi:hypothetical protein